MDNCSFNGSILIVDDNSNTLEIIQRNLSLYNYRSITCSSVKDAVEILKERDIALLITDNKMPQKTGMELISYTRDRYPHVGIIMITGYASINGAVDAIKIGADEYISKPFSDEELLAAVKSTIQMLIKRNKCSLPESNWKKFGIIGQSHSMKTVFNLIERACLNDATVLITGESGTGKELVARAIHYSHCSRSSGPFVAVNCPGIPETLFESELFGHTKGAFTGATESRIGYFYSAEKGTIFLDEISELSLQMQAKLLRTLQEKTVCKVGSFKNEPIDIRVVAASNKNLERLVEKELFREDLFYRLNILNINLPPLRERQGDVMLLTHHFAKKYSQAYNQDIPVFTDSAIKILCNYSWPGNIRELENLIQKCLITSEGGVIDSSDFPDKLKFNLTFSSDYNKSLKEIEKEHILMILNNAEGNKTKASEILKIDRKTLRHKLK